MANLLENSQSIYFHWCSPSEMREKERKREYRKEKDSGREKMRAHHNAKNLVMKMRYIGSMRKYSVMNVSCPPKSVCARELMQNANIVNDC